MQQAVQELTARALATVCVGTCSSFGGIPAQQVSTQSPHHGHTPGREFRRERHVSEEPWLSHTLYCLIPPGATPQFWSAAIKVRAAVANTGCQHLTLTAQNELSKDIPGWELNLSSSARGFGSDEMARVLRAAGLTNIYVSISGDVLTMGHNAKGKKWQVGIAAPLPEWRVGDPIVTVLSVSDQAVSTSGDYQKYFVDAQGRRLGHIFDPRTGWPVHHNLGSVSVVADSCRLSSSLATALFVLGPEAGPPFIETWTNAAALFVVREPDGKPRVIPSVRFAAMTGYQP